MLVGTAALTALRQVPARAEPLVFTDVYDAFFPYIWRSVQRLGVAPAYVDDVVQETFLVVYRKLGSFEGRSSLKTWLYGIALRVARAHRLRFRAAREVALDATLVGGAGDKSRPDEAAETSEAARLVNALLDKMDDDQREVFVLAELEQLSAPEIADALGVKLNTVYSRLRLGRSAFAEAAARHRAREAWRGR
jgi:RNA polymerase sigma-70 factor (ECF subfamily)